MKIKVGINGLGRIGRLVVRAAWDWDDIEFIQFNDPRAGNETIAHLLNFDSNHGRWDHDAVASGSDITVGGQTIRCSHNRAIADTDWTECDVVVEASGVMKSTQLLQAYLDQGIQRVVVQHRILRVTPSDLAFRSLRYGFLCGPIRPVKYQRLCSRVSVSLQQHSCSSPNRLN